MRCRLALGQRASVISGVRAGKPVKPLLLQDHSVMLVGYGSTREGKDYWTIKCGAGACVYMPGFSQHISQHSSRHASLVACRNSWSKYWGDSGYIKISRDHHGCGVTTDAIYAEVDAGDRDAAMAEQ